MSKPVPLIIAAVIATIFSSLEAAFDNVSPKTDEYDFLLVEFNSENQANKVFSFLKNQNIYVRKVTDYGLSKSLRITVGTNDECKLVKKNVQKFLELDNGL